VAGEQSAASEAITHFGGEVVRYIGDGIMAFFGYPVAHDNDAERAARAGLAILEAISQLNPQPAHPKLAVRIGIDSGPVVVGRGSNQAIDAFGDAANIAARVQATAEPNCVVVTAETHRLISGLFVVEDHGAQTLKGIEREVNLYRLVRPSGMRGRFEAAVAAGGLTPFVGREDELRLLLSRWEHAREGEGQVVTIIGEAGIGKSRLVRHFHDAIGGTPHTWIEAGAGAFFQNTPFYPVTEMLRQVLGGETEPEQVFQLAARLTAVGLKPAEAIPVLAPMLNFSLPAEYPPSTLPPDQQRRRLLATLVEWLLRSASTQPLFSVIEDLHWADPSTLELIQMLVEQGATTSLMLIYTARPEFRPPWPFRAHHTQITLNRLSVGEVRTMVGEVAARKALSDETIATVVERTSGVPLFVEELTRAVLGSGDGKPSGSAIPVTLHDSLMARLDRLGPAKEVAQIGAVIGGEFSYQLLHSVHQIAEPDLRQALRSLTDAELLHVRGIAPDAMYKFKHALIRDAAYGALLKSRRRELHRLIAEHQESTYGDRVGEIAADLANHYYSANENEKAIKFFELAGERASNSGALVEAEHQYSRALELLVETSESSERDRRELKLLIALGLALWGRKGWAHSETHRAFARAQALAEKLGDFDQLIPVLLGLAVSASVNGRVRRGLEVAKRALQLAERSEDRGLLCASHYILGNSLNFSARFVEARKHHDLAKSLFDETDTRPWSIIAGQYAAAIPYSVLHAGFLDQALQLIDASLELAGRRGNTYNLAFAHMCAAYCFFFLREKDDLTKHAIALTRFVDDYPFFTGYADHFAGVALLWAGKADEGIARVRKAAAFWNTIGFRMARDKELMMEAELSGREGRYVEAQRLMEGALRETEELLWDRSFVLRARANLFSQVGGSQAKIEAAFREAIEFARDHECRFEELQSTTHFARWLKSQGRGEEARAMLAEIYGWFTEGFGTLALREAKTLLEELSV
jgi:tetratricopeptide (TPR) repeat protein